MRVDFCLVTTDVQYMMQDPGSVGCFRLEDIGKMIRILNIFFKKDSATKDNLFKIKVKN